VDGKESYSVTESLKRDAASAVNLLYPNMASANSQVKVQLAETQAGDEILLISSMGQIISRTAIHSSTADLSTAGLAEGMYFVVLKSQQQRVLIDRLMIR
jgi:hypothetical protein